MTTQISGSFPINYSDRWETLEWAHIFPGSKVVEAITSFTSNPIVEVGAGRGFWASHLRKYRVSTEAFECEETYRNYFSAPPLIDDMHYAQNSDDFSYLEAYVQRGYAILICYPESGKWAQTIVRTVHEISFEGPKQLIFIGKNDFRFYGEQENEEFFQEVDSLGWEESVHGYSVTDLVHSPFNDQVHVGFYTSSDVALYQA